MLKREKVEREWQVYIAKSKLIGKMGQGVKTQFEAGNVNPWIERARNCRSLSALDKLEREFFAE